MSFFARGKTKKVCEASSFAYFFCVSICAILLFAAPVPAEQTGIQRAALIEDAEIRGLAEARPWQIFLRYRAQGRGYKSLVDDPDYFLSPSGKRDPQKELAASITALFEPAEKGDDHFACRFPARTEWLVEALEIDRAALPQPVCRKLDEAIATVDPRTAVLVFPAAHNNGPASMFGHTLLRIGSSYQSELLSYAINYAAFSTDTNGLIYAFKGLFGFYDGYFTVLPYYEKLNDYSDLEHRDVWEYRLNLTPEEVRRLVLHSWELQGIASDYYFFDENCSFMLLFLLEAARPEIELAQEYWDRLSFWVIPADTIATVRRAGLIEEVKYRPSLASRIQHRASLLSPEAAHLAYSVATQKIPADSLTEGQNFEEQRQILDLSAEYMRYRFSRKEIDENHFKKHFLPILMARSTLGPGETKAGEIPQPPQPEQGHDAGRWGTGIGVRDDRFFLELSWRPAYHDLLDPDEGFTQGAQINFFSLNSRYFPETRNLRLESFHLVDIFSLAPRDLFFKPVSWKVKGGLDRKPFSDGRDLLYLGVNTGGGMAWPFFSAGIFYLMAEADINLSDRFRDKTALGAGSSLGILTQLSPDWKAHLHGGALFYGLEQHEHYRIALDQNYRLSRRNGIMLKGLWERSFNQSRAEATIALTRYF
ncbi:protein of unknown function [Geoalkalibacter ferrihydriticus]|uniref:Uncharacterized protein n=1 Tax=Geoalkalibacter ferrihydriticus TaxID=392333 RepID=A0A1G9WZR5_9BACT|nr:DUF4105 domain-containing protein [Geoalkalibacter ferrihydriticus]SDM89666.1 protein of unknown function [Geoalkalibacter ferrihydriticus]